LEVLTVKAVRNIATFFAIAPLAASNDVPGGNPTAHGRQSFFAGHVHSLRRFTQRRVKALNQPKPLGGVMRQAISQVFTQYGWIISLLLIPWPSASLAGSISATLRGPKNQRVIRVEVCNYAHIDRTKLREAEGQAADLFAMAGVRIAWLNHSQKGRPVLSPVNHSNADFSVRIVYAFLSKRMRRPSEANALGESTVPLGTNEPTVGGIANVFYDRVKEVSMRWGLFPGQVLGDAIAHELGHLLLGVRHSSQGVMKASWNSRDLHLASRGRLQFLPAQAVELQGAARSLRQDRSPLLAALH
jgi:hypothetical protein